MVTDHITVVCVPIPQRPTSALDLELTTGTHMFGDIGARGPRGTLRARPSFARFCRISPWVVMRER
jgi:hypothetical protein